MPNLNTAVRGDFSDHIHSFLEKRFLERLVPSLVLNQFGMKKSVPAHGGTVIKWNRWVNPSANTTALSDGVSPDGITLTSATVSATLAQYGQFAATSDELQLVAINNTMEDMADLLAYGASLSIDTLVRNELDANGTQRYADAGSNSSKANVESGTDKMRSDELKIVLKAMRVANVPTFADGLYRGIVHPLCEFDLLSETAASTFVVLAANFIGGAKDVAELGNIGQAFGIKLLRSTNIRADATSTNTYGNIFLGKDAFGTVDIENAGLKTIVKPLGSAGTEDPLNQRATIGYKMWFVPKVLQALRAQIMWAYSV